MMFNWRPDTNDDGLKFRVDYSLQWQAVELRVVNRVQGSLLTAKIDWTPHTPGGEMPPTIRCHDGDDGLQNLFNALWDAGFRPPQRIANDDLLAAKDAVIRTKDEVIVAKDVNLTDLRNAIGAG